MSETLNSPDGEKGNFKSSARNLEYTDDFREFVRENQGTLSKVFRLLDSQRGYKPRIERFEDEEVAIKELCLLRGEQKIVLMHRYKVDVGEKSFFVKRTPVNDKLKRGNGFFEYQASQKMERLVKDIPWVEVVGYQLGYTHGSWSYFVSRWDDVLEKDLDIYLKELELIIQTSKGSEEEEKRYNEIRKKVEELRNLFGEDYFDFYEHNMAYDEDKDKIILFDLNRKRKDTIFSEPEG